MRRFWANGSPAVNRVGRPYLADPSPSSEKLIALDGCSGRELMSVAESLCRRLCDGNSEGGISAWDASGIFYSLDVDELQSHRQSARTLLLLFAAALSFRFR